MLLLLTVWICNSLINLFVFRMAVFAFVLSIRTTNLLTITQDFGSHPSIFCFNVISLSTITCGVSVFALLVPVWIITVSKSSCNKSFRSCCMYSTLPPGISNHKHCFPFPFSLFSYLFVFCVTILAIIFIFVINYSFSSGIMLILSLLLD